MAGRPPAHSPRARGRRLPAAGRGVGHHLQERENGSAADPGDQAESDRQATVLGAAVERGYDDTPRQCTLTELADALGVAKSTCSETLHRAEETVVKQFVERRQRENDLRGAG